VELAHGSVPDVVTPSALAVGDLGEVSRHTSRCFLGCGSCATSGSARWERLSDGPNGFGLALLELDCCAAVAPAVQAQEQRLCLNTARCAGQVNQLNLPGCAAEAWYLEAALVIGRAVVVMLAVSRADRDACAKDSVTALILDHPLDARIEGGSACYGRVGGLLNDLCVKGQRRRRHNLLRCRGWCGRARRRRRSRRWDGIGRWCGGRRRHYGEHR
jgi:hypothetical protein